MVKSNDFEELVKELQFYKNEVKELRTKLAESENRNYLFEQIFNNAPNGIRIVDKNFNTLCVNKYFSHISGLTEADFLNNKCFEISKDPSCGTENCPVHRALKGEKIITYEFERGWNTKERKTFLLTGRPFYSKDGVVMGLIEYVKDISKEKKSENALADSQKKYKSFIDKCMDGVFIVDKDGNYLEVNTAGCELYGYTEEEFLKMKIVEVLIPGDEKGLTYFNELMKKGKEKFELETVRKDGKIITVEISAVSLNNGLTMGFVRDVTERIEAEKALKKSENQYRTIFNNSPMGIIHINSEGEITACNDKFLELVGSERTKVIGFNMITGLDNNEMKLAVKSSLTGNLGCYQGYYKSVTGGKVTPINVIFKGIFSEGQFVGAVGIFEDIARRIKAEEALRESEKQHDTILNGISDLVVLYEVVNDDSELKVLKLSQSFLDTVGINKSDVIGRTIKEVTPNKIADNILDKFHEAKKYGKLVKYEESFNNLIIETTIVPVFNDENNCKHIIVVGKDITQKKKIEEHFSRTEKLESVGLLAGGIAHDFNNILTVVAGNISLAKAKISIAESTDIERCKELLAEAEKASLQAKDLTQQLLTFAKGGAPIIKTVSIQELLKESVTFALHGSNVGIRFDIQEDLWDAEVDEGQINQVLHNLIINADQAMPHGGILSVKAKNMTINENNYLPLKKGKYIKISIMDQGIGIPKEILDKIFDPYFTTKQKGSGLGLATSYSIVNKHNGLIEVESTPGVGTTFYLYLPASMKDRELKISDINQELKKKVKGKILLMDDDIAVREIVKEMLSEIGYDVDCAKDGQELLENYINARNVRVSFDVVIMDLTIPGGMGGKEAIKKLLQLDPNINAIVASGYSNDPVMANYKDYGFKGVVTKPFSMDQLIQVLNKIS